MVIREGESVWKLLIGAVALVFFFCVGIAHVFYPDRFRRFTLRKEGELLTEFNRIGTRFVGLIFAVFAACVLYLLAKDVLVR